jgi:hypothetical protein
MEHARCHCGEVEWEVKLEDKSHILCHCNGCASQMGSSTYIPTGANCYIGKMLSGGAYTLNQVVPRDNLRITKGELKKYTYTGDSGNPVHCYYCPNCTTHVRVNTCGGTYMT